MFTLIAYIQTWVSQRVEDRDRGASAVEYGLLVGLIAVAIIGVLIILGPQLAGLFSSVSNQLPTPAGG